MSIQQHQFILDRNDSTRTFDYDEKLPNLPVPSLESTILRYLESVKPFAEDDQEYQRTKRIAYDFLTGEGALLHSKLLEHAAKHRNWVEKWWEDYAYLTLREPLIPHYNMVGLHPTIPGYPYGPGQQIRLASAYCHQMVRLWQVLRQEKLKPVVTASKQPLSMDQFRRIFNCSVAPGLSMDTIQAYFKTEREGSCPSHLVVLSKGHMFVVEAVRQDGQLLSESEWEHQLTLVQQTAATDQGLDIPCLSCDYRSTWAQNRQHLKELSPENATMLAAIESAMFVVCLDDTLPSSEAAVSHLLLCGDYCCRWPDHASNLIFFSNGLSGGLCVHSAFDGIVSGIATMFAHTGVLELARNWTSSQISPNLNKPHHLKFILDPFIQSEIKRVKIAQEFEKRKFVMRAEEFRLFGKERIQSLKTHPDAFIQMALQLAYFRLHSRFAPCYETATTRTFYHGRTETVRSCSEQCVLWVKSMMDQHEKGHVRAKLLLTAINKHNELMTRARNNEGCDRHLFGLYCIAVENNLPIPELYLDPLYKKSGGGGNFILSTSLLGYSPTVGGVAPMCLHGYGVFYSILPESLLFTISVSRDSPYTSTNKLFHCLCRSLVDMISLLETHKSSKL